MDTSSRDRAAPRLHADSPVRWQVRLLGAIELNDGATRLTRLPSRAITALLARLALAPERAHAREELIELLWPGVALGVGRNRLRQALSTLKSLLEPASALPSRAVLLADRTHVRVAPDAFECDATQFEQAVRAGRAPLAREIYRGELMPGFYDDWIDEERLRLAALHERLEHSMPAPDSARATAPAPVAATTVRGGVGSARVSLPTYLTRMFGAQGPASRLRSVVLAHRLVTLIGPGGAGKTRLAVEVAQSLRGHADWPLPVDDPARPFDLIAFVPLVACSTRAQVLDALTVNLRLASDARDPLDAVRQALSDRHVLVVLDNFEQLVGQAEALVAQLLADAPDLHVIVTSRRALGLDGEHEFGVDALALPPRGAGPADAADNPAVALFVERARAVRADFHLGARNAATLVDLVRALEGMPLAIELAASRVRSISPSDMLARLHDGGTPRLDLLARSGPRAAADPRHASMQRVIEWSWNLLNDDQARLLSALTAFADSFSAPAARLVAQREGFDAALVLDDLVASSLVQRQADADELRFRLYQPIREFVVAHQPPPARRHWRGQLRAWSRQWAAGLPRTPPLPELRTEMPNLVAALASAVEDDVPGEAVETLLCLRRCLEDVELPAEGLAHAQAAVAHCADDRLRARGHTLLAPLLFAAGQADAALQAAQAGLACDGLDAAQRARALHALARVRWRSRRQASEVEPLLDEAQGLIRGADEADLQASLFALRAFVANAFHRDLVAGERLHGQALALWESLGHQHAINSGRYNLAVCAQHAGRNAECLQRLEPVIASAQALQDWRRLSQSLNVRGNACAGLRDWDRAVASYRECIATAWRTMASYDLALGLWNLPRALAHRRRPQDALRLAGFAAHFWRSRFGELSANDRRDLDRVRRLARRQGVALEADALWRDGEQLSLPQAVALAQDA